MLLWVQICPKFGTENLSENFLAEMEFHKIDPWKQVPIGNRSLAMLVRSKNCQWRHHSVKM
jgi:hypothetical protein